MAFRIREISVHLTGNGQCMPASPDPLCPTPTKPPDPVCMGKSSKHPHPQGDPPGGPKKRLQAQLREALAPPPL